MTDLSTELRDCVCAKLDKEQMCDGCKLRLKAADEIDRLRNDLADVQKGYDLMREAILDIRSETSDGRILARCDSVVTCDRSEP